MTTTFPYLFALLIALAAACAADPATPAPTANQTAALQGQPKTAELHVYADFRCPHCARFSASYTPRILAHFEDQITSGRLQFEHRNFPVLGPKSEYLALHAECARSQGRFQQFHDAIYLNQYRATQDKRIPYIDDPGPNLSVIDRLAGIDAKALEQCIANGDQQDTVLSHINSAEELGIRSTPTVVLNGRILKWDGYDSIITHISAELSQRPP